MNTKKKIKIILISSFVFLFPSLAFAQLNIETLNQDSIKSVDEIMEYNIDKDKGIFEEKQIVKQINYLDIYQTKNLFYNGFEISENLNLKTPNTEVYLINETPTKKIYQIKLYFKKQFEKINDEWLEIKTATTSLDNYNLYLSPKSFFINSVNAQSTIYSGSGDGVVANSVSTSNTWAQVHDAGAGNVVDYTSGVQYLQCDKTSNWDIWRAFFTADLTSITGTITSAEFHFTVDNKGGVSNINANLVSANQNSINSLSTDDFNEYGTTQFSDSDIIISSTGEKIITLNTSGITYLNDSIGTTSRFALMESPHDIENVEVNTTQYAGIRFSEYTGTASDPYLLLTIEEETEVLTNSASTTLINDIAWITAIASTTASGSITYFYLPAVPLLFLTIIFIFIASRIILEFLIRWRNSKNNIS